MSYPTRTADLAIRDLTDPAQGPHAIQLLVDAILAATTAHRPAVPLIVHRGERIVDVADNYDHLGYSPDAAARDARYTRYVSATRMLRSQTSALIPGALRTLTTPEALIACPGIVYRRDSIDRLHTGTPHQLDLWRIATDRPVDRLDTSPPTRENSTHDPAVTSTHRPAVTSTRHPAVADDSTRGPVSRSAGRAGLIELVAVALGAALPGRPWRTRPATHPYTTDGLEIEAWSGEAWVEVGECGVAAAHVLRAAAPDAVEGGLHGLALGLGLDRLLMLRKGIGDIRLLRSADPRVAGQMTSLDPYRPVPSQPAARRDLSLAMPAGVTAEDLGDRIRELLGPDADLVEEVTIRSTTPAADLPTASRQRLAIRDDEVNVLLRVILRDPHATLPGARANALRDRIWHGLAGTHPAAA
ncbi:hypothetical protein [Actinoplanes sp. NPDC026619]|uniref:tRNA ligase subunit PheS family protein n=1 Tax=Actinoplanes sp. NPDC026619 TaxID=3155798 RepID=UPI00340EDDD8